VRRVGAVHVVDGGGIMHILQVSLCSIGCLVVTVGAGCDSSDVLTVPVRGKVTFSGQAPPAAGSIVFNPLSTEDGMPRRPGRAQFDEQGNFQATSFKEHDGLVPGVYQPVISCWKGMPSGDDPSSYERLNHVPIDFQATELRVEKGKSQVEANYDVPPKKPN
jgi:hypothetical protein